MIEVNYYYVIVVIVVLIALFKIRRCSKCGKPAWKHTVEEQDWSGAQSYFYKGVQWHKNKYVSCPFCGYEEIIKSKETTSNI